MQEPEGSLGVFIANTIEKKGNALGKNVPGECLGLLEAGAVHKKVRALGDRVREVSEKGGSPGRSCRLWNGLQFSV